MEASVWYDWIHTIRKKAGLQKIDSFAKKSPGCREAVMEKW